MCGIVGIFERPSSSHDELGDRVRRMSEVMKHRGPDDADDYVDADAGLALGFRRLAILDLSPRGRQPMRSETGRYVMVFNGEIYNFQALRTALVEEGASFRGGSDTEVILAAFERWGVDATLPQMNGMFAIALWDRERRELTLIRDRLGIKPLYVGKTGGGMAFSSELGPLMELTDLDKSLDLAATLAYLGYLFAPAPGTPLRAVRKLPPGHLLRIRAEHLAGGLPSPEPYWELTTARAAGRKAAGGSGASEAESLEELRSLLTDSVRLRLVADVPVGAFLSGGIDSSLVVALMQQLASGPVKTFTIGFDQPEHDESEDARAVAEHLGTDHTELPVSDQDALDLVERLPEFFDEPLADPSQMPTYLVSQLARGDVTVALSGDGGDELFAGYTRYRAGLGMLSRWSGVPSLGRKWVGSALRAVPPTAWSRIQTLQGGGTRLLAQKAYKFGRVLDAPTPGEMYRRLLAPGVDPERFVGAPGSAWDPIRDSLGEITDGLTLGDMQLVDQRYYLPDDLLQKVDRASMAVSLECRVPILDHRVVEFSWTLPDRLKIRGGEGKWLLRQLLYEMVPQALLDRPKTGFTVPVEAWLRGALREMAEDRLLSASPVRDALFDQAAVRRSWDRLMAGRNEEALALWAILMFEAWRDRWRITDVAAEAELSA